MNASLRYEVVGSKSNTRFMIPLSSCRPHDWGADDVLPFRVSIQPAHLLLRSYATAASWVLHSSTKAPKGVGWMSRGSSGRAAERSCRAPGEPSPRFAQIPGGAKARLPRLLRQTPELAA